MSPVWNRIGSRGICEPWLRPVIVSMLASPEVRALYEAGIRVPEDMAIVGFDGILLGQFTTPALTTMNQPRDEMGRLAADMLFHLLEGQPPLPSERVLSAELLVRESCGAVPRIKRM